MHGFYLSTKEKKNDYMTNCLSLRCLCPCRVLSAAPYNLNKKGENMAEKSATLSNTSEGADAVSTKQE